MLHDLKYRDIFIVYIGAAIILMMLLRNSWLPGAKFINGKENFVIFFSFIVILIIFLDFDKIIRVINVPLLKKNNFNINALIVLFIISLLLFNSQEIFSFLYLQNTLSYIIYIIIYFFILPSIFIKRINFLMNFLSFFSFLGFLTSFFGIFLLFLGLSPNNRVELVSYSVHPNYISFFITNTFLITCFLFLIKK